MYCDVVLCVVYYDVVMCNVGIVLCIVMWCYVL